MLVGEVGHRWIEHTGELELELTGASERELFAHGLAAMRELLGGGEAVGGGDAASAAPAPERRALELAAPDHAALLADWLAELALLAETERLVPERLARLELGGEGLRACVETRRAAPPHLVKGVTYHRLALEPTDGGWRARVVLDV
ncbi:MAG: archease [Nocardioidaceae bacterium]